MVDFFDSAVVESQGAGVAGVDELCCVSVQGDPQELAGGQDSGFVLEKGVVGVVGLFGEGGCDAAGAS